MTKNWTPPPKDKKVGVGWYHGYALKNPTYTGIFPATYVQIKNISGSDTEGWEEENDFDEDELYSDDPVLAEVTSVLLDWRDIWRSLYILRDDEKFNEIQIIMEQLMEMRRTLISGTLTAEQTREMKLKISEKIDNGNDILDLDMTPREDNGERVDIDKHGVIYVFNTHIKCEQKATTNSSLPTNLAGLSPNFSTNFVSQSSQNYNFHVSLREFSYGSSIFGSVSDNNNGSLADNVQLRFSLYSGQLSSYISEFVVMRPPEYGAEESGAIFLDVGSLNKCRDLYLVIQVIRIGRMLLHEYKKPGSTSYKRPFAVGVFNISKVASAGVDGNVIEFETRLQACEDKDFHHLHELILKKSGTRYNAVSSGQNSRVVVDVRLMAGELDQLRRDHQLLFHTTPISRKLGFPNTIMPGDVRNDLYLTIDKGTFERGGKAAARNIEVTTMIFDKEGNLIENCIHSAATLNEVGETKVTSPILYHTNSPNWYDTVRLQVPIEKFYGAHIRLEYRHCSAKDRSEKRFLGFSFVNLMDIDQTTIKDGNHTLCVYKFDDTSKSNNVSIFLPSASSLKGVSTQEQALIKQGFVKSTKENVYITTKLCSTKLTQNIHLMSLLKWKTNPDITDTLNKVMKLGGEEIVKFLQDVLDALFAMFSTEDGNSTSHSGLVFHVIVSIISYLEDPKFEHFRPVMDNYIAEHFASSLVYKGLLSCVRHCADLVMSTDKQEPIQKCFKALEYISKFVVQSRILFARATGGENEDSFRVDVHLLFNSFNNMMSSTSPTVLPSQVIFLKHISSVYAHFLQILPVVDIARLVTLLFDTIPKYIPSDLLRAKLIAIRSAVNSPVFQDPESRSLLLSTSLIHVKQHLLEKEELRLCSDILGDIVTFLHIRNNNPIITKDIEKTSNSILEPLMRTILQMDRVVVSNIVASLVSCLAGVIQLMSSNHFIKLWEQIVSRKQIKEFLLQSFLLFQELIKVEPFPHEWFTMRFLVSSIILKTIQEFANPLILYFQEDEYFDSQLWTNYFTLGVSFIKQSSLQLENHSESKKKKILKRYGDMRKSMSLQVLSLWEHLGGMKVHFIPGMVGPFLEMTLISEPEIRRSTLPLFYDLLECEYHIKTNFRQVETELIDKLDILVSENKGDEDYKQLFNTMDHLSNSLMESLAQKNPIWRENGQSFVLSVTRLLERLLDYRNVIQGDENRDKRMSCTVNLLNFYQSEVNRHEMYLRYIYKLHDLHIPADNYAEAGFTLKLHADQLAWSNRTLHSDLRYPTQKEWQRKELLYLKILDYLDKGKQWEAAIPLTKELADFYERRIYDYQKLSGILKRQAQYFEKIISNSQEELRLDPEYYRVGFYGQGFPLFVRNKEFVYRGMECEKLGTFTQRLLTEYPNAAVLTTNSIPESSILESDSQYIQICCVKPISNYNNLSSDSTYDIPERIRKFHLVNNVDTFQYDRPFHKGQKSVDNEFKTLWIERTTLHIQKPLPGVLRWFEVDRSKTTELSPIQHACETIEIKNREIRHLMSPGSQINKNLTQSLQGVIDAAVNGGISKYQDAFFSPDSVVEHEDFRSRLKAGMYEQVAVLESALTVHEGIVPQELMPLHLHLVERLSVMKKSLPEFNRQTFSDRRKSSSIINTPLPPVPSQNVAVRSPATCHTTTSLMNLDYIDDVDEQIYCKPSDLLSCSDDIMTTSCPFVNDYVWDDGDDDVVDLVGKDPTSKKSRKNDTYAIYSNHRMSINSSSPAKRNTPGGGSTLLTPSSKGMTTGSINRLKKSVERDSGHVSSESFDDAPPLPPRSTCRINNRYSNVFCESPVCEDPPALPRRTSRKIFANSDGESELNLSIASSRSLTPEFPALSPRRSSNILPPPVPPKAASAALPPMPPSDLPLLNSNSAKSCTLASGENSDEA
ncbi:dedicator of cytokinesis protein 3 isoform X3 [Lepeophtheirus salmonis]|uniref:dedicator of cytokinesis protein 3 isoform X3 n=1 Tax=Lepeophtheirus salmonis TaxID=72036 RepID=UPI001AE13376|nr:dedicator of cytokinesis protein 3-like isoform X3 [Lepeophtheirus salmonis]